jgi:hypothetical protein
MDRLRESARTTNSPYVLVEVVDGNRGESRVAAVPYGALHFALRRERGITSEEADGLIASRDTRRMEFADEKALRNVWPRYSISDLEATRALLRERSPEQIVADQMDLESPLGVLSRERTGEPYGLLACVLHVLLERGVPCGASCKPGLAYLDAPTDRR